MLQHDTDYLTREPTGVGLDVPAWLVALEEEVEDGDLRESFGMPECDLATTIAPVLLSYEDAKRQLDDWASRQEAS